MINYFYGEMMLEKIIIKVLKMQIQIFYKYLK